MTSPSEPISWEIATLLAQPEHLFVIWAIGTGLCHQDKDFHEHFEDEPAIDITLADLRQRNFVELTESRLVLTALGETVLAHFARSLDNDRIHLLREAVAMYRSLLNRGIHAVTVDKWADVHYQLGLALAELVVSATIEDKERRVLLNDAVVSLHVAQTVYTQDADPKRWSQVQDALSKMVDYQANNENEKEPDGPSITGRSAMNPPVRPPERAILSASVRGARFNPLSQRSDMTVFLNGEFIPADQARVGVATHAISYGTGCFEGIRAYYNAEADQLYIFRALEHFERLHRSCKIMNIRLPWSPEELVGLTIELIRRNGLREDCYIRPFAYKADEIIGVKLNGLRDDYTMFTFPMGDYVSTNGLRCMVSSWRRVDDNMIPARAKISGAYVNSAFAKSEALMSGFDEAIMLTQDGHVSEGSAENLFMVTDGELVTPPPSENILLGITRDAVIEIARREMEMLTVERVIDRTELYVADEIFLTGTGAQIAPVAEVDHRPIGTGDIGKVGSTLQRLYREITRGKRSEYASWLTAVYPARVASEQSGHNARHASHEAKPKRSKSAAPRLSEESHNT